MNYTYNYYSLIAIFLFIKLLEHCNNDFELFVRYMSYWYED